MNIKQINYFIAVANHGSLSSAAREFDISVQAMSKAMTDLENEFGENLFERTHQGITLTPLGETFCKKAEPVSASFQTLEQMGEAHAKEFSKLRLFLCAPLFCRNAKARADMAAFFDKYLKAETEVSIGTGETGLGVIREGGCDALITIGAFSNAAVDCVSVGTVSPGVVMAKNHPLAGRDSVSLADLADYPVSLSSEFDNFNESIVTVYRKRKTDMSFITLDPHDFDRHIMVENGVCLMVYIPALGEMYPGTVIRPIASGDAVAVPICLVSLKDRKTSSYLAFERWLAGELVVLGGGAPTASTK